MLGPWHFSMFFSAWMLGPWSPIWPQQNPMTLDIPWMSYGLGSTSEIAKKNRKKYNNQKITRNWVPYFILNIPQQSSDNFSGLSCTLAVIEHVKSGNLEIFQQSAGNIEPVTLIEKYMAQSRCIGLYGPFTNLPFWGCAMYFDYKVRLSWIHSQPEIAMLFLIRGFKKQPTNLVPPSWTLSFFAPDCNPWGNQNGNKLQCIKVHQITMLSSNRFLRLWLNQPMNDRYAHQIRIPSPGFVWWQIQKTSLKPLRLYL